MACGMPVVCFEDSGGTPSMLDAGGGAVVPFGDVDGMATLVQEWTSDPKSCRDLGERARQIVQERYSMDHYVKWLLARGLS